MSETHPLTDPDRPDPLLAVPTPGTQVTPYPGGSIATHPGGGAWVTETPDKVPATLGIK